MATISEVHASLIESGINGAKVLLDHAAADLTAEMLAIRRGKIQDACRAYKRLRDAYEELDTVRKKINEQIENLSRVTIPEMLAENEVTTITLEWGDLKYRFTKSTRMSCSMVDKDAGMQWLREQGHEDLIQETVNASTLAAFAKNQIEKEGIDLPTGLFKVSTMSFTSVTKA